MKDKNVVWKPAVRTAGGHLAGGDCLKSPIFLRCRDELGGGRRGVGWILGERRPTAGREASGAGIPSRLSPVRNNSGGQQKWGTGGDLRIIFYGVSVWWHMDANC
jgi:hypothetical protein